jgi:hypothetical protein
MMRRRRRMLSMHGLLTVIIILRPHAPRLKQSEEQGIINLEVALSKSLISYIRKTINISTEA